MDRHRVALLLAVVGLFCILSPVYLPAAANATSPPPRTTSVYAAEPIDLDNASDREQLVDAHGRELTFGVDRIDAPGDDDYRSPSVTRQSLRTAMREGSATVDDPGARADLREIAASHRFVRPSSRYVPEDTGPGTHYRLTVAENGSVVRAENVSTRVVANAIAAEASRYRNLSPGEQRTVDRVLDNSTEEEWGYRPRVDAPFAEEIPTAVRKDGMLYSIEAVGHVDSVGPGFLLFYATLPVAAFGVVLLLTAGALAAYDRWRD